MDENPIFLKGLSEEQLQSIKADYEIRRAIIDHYTSIPKEKLIPFKNIEKKMKTIKYRVDFSAHQSIVVEVPDTERSEDEAIALAEEYMYNMRPSWEMDDGGVEEAEEDEEPINNVDIDFIN